MVIPMSIRALVKGDYLVMIKDNLHYFSLKTYVVTPHLNRLDETIEMSGHNISYMFSADLSQTIIKYSLLYRALMTLTIIYHLENATHTNFQ